MAYSSTTRRAAPAGQSCCSTVALPSTTTPPERYRPTRQQLHRRRPGHRPARTCGHRTRGELEERALNRGINGRTRTASVPTIRGGTPSWAFMPLPSSRANPATSIPALGCSCSPLPSSSPRHRLREGWWRHCPFCCPTGGGATTVVAEAADCGIADIGVIQCADGHRRGHDRPQQCAGRAGLTGTGWRSRHRRTGDRPPRTR
jgi:hypothetical protein